MMVVSFTTNKAHCHSANIDQKLFEDHNKEVNVFTREPNSPNLSLIVYTSISTTANGLVPDKRTVMCD